MVFINYKDNSYLDADGFAPFGQVVVGMDVVDKLYGGYGRTNVPDQRRIKSEGNAYLTAEYPKLDFIKKATIERRSSQRAARDRQYRTSLMSHRACRRSTRRRPSARTDPLAARPESRSIR